MSVNRFITVTMKPLFERTLVLKFLAPGYQNKAIESERLYPSGHAMNIGRAIQMLECDSHAVLLLGNDLTGRAYRALVVEEGFGITDIYLDGPTASQTFILDRGHDKETIITTEGAQVTDADIQRLADTLTMLVTKEDVVVFSGPLPVGAPEDCFVQLIDVVHAAGAEAILLTGGAELESALGTHPEMVVLNQLECESMFNIPIRVQEDLLQAAEWLCEKGAGEVLIEILRTSINDPLVPGDEQMLEHVSEVQQVTLSGALYVSRDGKWEISLPELTKGTTSGVWEALIAGLLVGRSCGLTIEVALEKAAAAAAYAADKLGSKFPGYEKLEKYRSKVQVQKIN